VFFIEPDEKLLNIDNIDINQPFVDYLFNTNTCIVMELLKDLNPDKSMGPDSLHPLVLKEGCENWLYH
jgi:hypothetical protein